MISKSSDAYNSITVASVRSSVSTGLDSRLVFFYVCVFVFFPFSILLVVYAYVLTGIRPLLCLFP